MNTIFEEQFRVLLPLAVAWAEEQESIILKMGIKLTEAQIAGALRLGVCYPERVRLLKVNTIPTREEPSLKAAAAAATQLITSRTAGLTLRYGIFVRSDCWHGRDLILHELVHTSQYERLGGLLKSYCRIAA